MKQLHQTEQDAEDAFAPNNVRPSHGRGEQSLIQAGFLFIEERSGSYYRLLHLTRYNLVFRVARLLGRLRRARLGDGQMNKQEQQANHSNRSPANQRGKNNDASAGLYHLPKNVMLPLDSRQLRLS
jgi:hypothetical protein